MTTLKLIVLSGILASGVAIGLSHLLAALTGGSVTGDEMVRQAIIAFVMVAAAFTITRRHGTR